MTFYEYVNDNTIKNVKLELEKIIGIPYGELIEVSKKIRKIYNSKNTNINKNEYLKRYNEIYYESVDPIFLSEFLIHRISTLNSISERVEKGDSGYDDVVFCMCLSYIINWNFLDISILWNIEYERKNNIYVTEDNIIFDYYRLFAFIFLQITGKIISQFTNESTTSYLNEINKILVKIR